MANTNLTNDLIFKEANRHFRNNTIFVNSCKPSYDDTYQFKGSKAGEAIRLEVPQEYSVRETIVQDIQDVEEKNVTLTRSVIRGVDIKYSSPELTQDIDGFADRKIKPAMAALAAKVDSYCMDVASDGTAQQVALPVTNLDRVDVTNSGVILDEGLAPRDGRKLIITPQACADLVQDSSALFNNSQVISQQYKDGIISAPYYGYDIGQTTNVSTHTAGGFNTSYDVATVPSSGATTLDIDTGTGTIKKGDTFTIDSVFAVDANTKVSTGKLKKFVVTADSAGGTVTINISPAIISTGPYQNVDSLPADADDLVFTNTASSSTKQGLAFAPGAYAVGFCDLDLPEEAAWAQRRVEDGVSMRIIKGFDMVNSVSSMRIDVLFGVTTVIDRWGCRLSIPA